MKRQRPNPARTAALASIWKTVQHTATIKRLGNEGVGDILGRDRLSDRPPLQALDRMLRPVQCNTLRFTECHLPVPSLIFLWAHAVLEEDGTLC